jgi:integrase
VGNGVSPGSKSSIAISFYYKGVRCRERIKLAPNPRNLKHCERLKARIESEIESGDFNYGTHFPDSMRSKMFATEPGESILLKDYLDKWIKNCERYLKASTLAGYKKVVNGQLIPEFGSIYLSDLKRKDVKKWCDGKNVSHKTLRNLVSPLRIALDEAVEDELISANPLAGWKIKLRIKDKRPTKNTVDPFSKKEQAAILNKLTGQERNLIEFAFLTGLRTSELCALEWNDIDFVQCYAYVTKALTQAADEPETTKTDCGERRVKLIPLAIDVLNRQKEHTFLKCQEVFQNPRLGERWDGDQKIRKNLWIPALKRAGVRYRKPYQTRHTYASMMLMSGVHPRVIAPQIGHTDWTFTAKTYARWIPEDDATEYEKFADWATFGQ